MVALMISASGSAAGTAVSPQIYVGSSPDYTVAFKVEGSRVTVLALNAAIYCTFTHPRERFPGTMYMFQGPTLMREGSKGLEAPLRPAGGPSSYVDAKLAAGRLTGTFALDQNEGSADCQTAAYLPARPAVKFEAVRYEPAGSGATKPPTKGEIPIYYGNEGGLEVLLETIGERVDFRGAAPATCPVAGRQPARQRVPLFGDVENALIRGGGGFNRVFRHDGRIGGMTWSEAASISGGFEGQAISGTYARTATMRPASGSPRRCKTGPLQFRAVRYLPAQP